jgi:hypothetical protein
MQDVASVAAGVQHDIAPFDGAVRQIQIYGITVMKERDHAASCHRHGYMGLPFMQKLADHIQKRLRIQNMGHGCNLLP